MEDLKHIHKFFDVPPSERWGLCPPPLDHTLAINHEYATEVALLSSVVRCTRDVASVLFTGTLMLCALSPLVGSLTTLSPLVVKKPSISKRPQKAL